MLRTIAMLLLMATSLQAQATQPAWQKIPGGQLILRPFVNAPFPHKSRENGFKNFPRDPHYVDSTVAIFIPDNFRQADAVSYVVHFHGHKNHVAKVLKDYKLTEQFAAAKVNAILIVPQGPKDAADSSGGKLEDPGVFSRLMSEIGRFLKSEKKIRANSVDKVVLTAHSGGYQVASRILYHGGLGREISDVLLLDASYGGLPTFANFAHNNPGTRLVSLYTDHLADENAQLKELLTGLGVKFNELDEKTLKDADLTERCPIFFHTKGPHEQVPVDYFGRLVRTSALTK